MDRTIEIRSVNVPRSNSDSITSLNDLEPKIYPDTNGPKEPIVANPKVAENEPEKPWGGLTSEERQIKITDFFDKNNINKSTADKIWSALTEAEGLFSKPDISNVESKQETPVTAETSTTQMEKEDQNEPPEARKFAMISLYILLDTFANNGRGITSIMETLLQEKVFPDFMVKLGFRREDVERAFGKKKDLFQSMMQKDRASLLRILPLTSEQSLFELLNSMDDVEKKDFLEKGMYANKLLLQPDEIKELITNKLSVSHVKQLGIEPKPAS